MIEFEVVHPGDARAQVLIGELSAEIAARYVGVYPLDGRSNFRAEDHDPGRDAFLLVRLEGLDVGCGALRRFGDCVAEIKRMYIRPVARGRGLSRELLAALEREAVARRYHTALVETGTQQPEALSLYTSSGYRPTDPWPPYDTRPYARCFSKALPAEEA